MSTQEILDPAEQRYKCFCDQNVDEGHFDVTFQFGNSQDSDGNPIMNDKPLQQLHAHSFILWPSSKVFEKTLFGPLAHKGPIPIIRHSFADFKEFLTFMYRGYCNITMDNVMALVDLGEYYETKLLKKQCDAFLTKNSTKIENVLKVYESLKVYSLEGAMAKVMEFVAGNTVEILKSDEFLRVKKETVLDIVKMKTLKAKQEEVFEAVCKWGEHNCPEDTVNKHEFLKQQLEDVIPLIDFSEMDFNFLNNFVVRNGFLFSTYDDLANALCEAAGKTQRAKEERLKIVQKRRRVQITGKYDFKGYADICDPVVIEAIEKMIASNSSSQLISISNDIYQWKANIDYPQKSLIAQYCLVKDSSGNLAFKHVDKMGVNPHIVCCHQYTRNYDVCNGCKYNKQNTNNEKIIAPIFVPNGRSFTPDSNCKIEFV